MTKLTKKQINRIAAAAFAAVMATSMTIPAFASGNVLASEAPNGLYSSTAGNIPIIRTTRLVQVKAALLSEFLKLKAVLRVMVKVM